MKKILAVLLAILMAFSAMSVVAYAADGQQKEDAAVEEVPEEGTEEKAKFEFPLFKDLKGKITLPQFAIQDFGSAALYVVFFPLLALVQGLLIIVFVVLDVLNLDLADLNISL